MANKMDESANHLLNEGLICKIYKELSKLNNKTIQLKTWAKYMKRHFTEDRQTANKHLKDISHHLSLTMKEMQIKTTRRQHCTPIRMAEGKTTDQAKHR